MKMISQIFKVLCILILLVSCLPKPPKIECSESLDQISELIGNQFNADTIYIRSRVLKEEIYFPTLIVFELELINPTTKTLDFKKLDSTEYKRFENYQQIQSNLQSESKELLSKLDLYCELKEFTNLIVKFTRNVDDTKLNYSIGSNIELSNYLKGHSKSIKY